ncbi:hypothetical protein [Bradyrhizobium sp.]|uniref:hypothetical protein n=1 Tax=Bradyrhizobium sp. TaxID=376 RepID=UPI002E18B14B
MRQHYTTSAEMASVLSAYLVSNGAADTRTIGGQPKQAKDAKQEPSGQPAQLDRYGRPIRRAPTQEASRPDADGRMPQTEPGGRQGRNRLANPDAAKPAIEGQPPADAANERGPDGRKLSAKQRLSKRGKPAQELPKADAAKTDAPMGEAAKGAAPKDENPNLAKDEGNKPEVKPEEEKSDSAKLDAPKGEANRSDVPLRADPVPAVTPAPKLSEGEAKPAELAPESTAASSAVSEPQGGSTPTAPPPSIAVTAPPPPPVAPAGPPAPPISQ